MKNIAFTSFAVAALVAASGDKPCTSEALYPLISDDGLREAFPRCFETDIDDVPALMQRLRTVAENAPTRNACGECLLTSLRETVDATSSVSTSAQSALEGMFEAMMTSCLDPSLVEVSGLKIRETVADILAMGEARRNFDDSAPATGPRCTQYETDTAANKFVSGMTGCKGATLGSFKKCMDAQEVTREISLGCEKCIAKGISTISSNACKDSCNETTGTVESCSECYEQHSLLAMDDCLTLKQDDAATVEDKKGDAENINLSGRSAVTLAVGFIAVPAVVLLSVLL